MSSTTPATEPPEVSAEGSVGSGGSLLRAIRDGQLPPPPAAQLLGLDLVDVHYGHVVFNFHPATQFDNGQAAIHGGVLAAVVDFAVSTGVLTTVDIGTTVVTSNLNVTFIRPVHPDNGTLRGVGTRPPTSPLGLRRCNPHRHRWPHPRTSDSHLPPADQPDQAAMMADSPVRPMKGDDPLDVDGAPRSLSWTVLPGQSHATPVAHDR